jgi:PAS domain S-box-containing protein
MPRFSGPQRSHPLGLANDTTRFGWGQSSRFARRITAGSATFCTPQNDGRSGVTGHMPIRDLLNATNFFEEPMALVSVDGTIDTSNQPFAQQFGVSVEALKGRRLDALASASAAAIQEYLRACVESENVVRGSLLLRRRAETVALQTRGIAYPPRSGPSASQVLLRLVTQSRTASEPGSADQAQPSHWREVEESLRRQSRLLEVTLASIGDAVIVTDKEGRATFLNAVAEALTGWRTEEAKGKPLIDVFRIVNERTRKLAEDPVAKVLRTGNVCGLANHTVLLSRDGREVPIDDSAAPIRAPDGELFGVVLIFRDITEQRRAEHTRSWLAAIIESSEDAIVSKTLNGTVTSWNPGAARLFGYEPEEIIGRSITTIIPADLRHEEEEVLARIRRGERVEHFETQRLTKNGRRIDISLTVSPVRDEEGSIVGASKIARDITERKRAERLLYEADRRKDEFLATLAHELRNPLAPIRNTAELLCREQHERPELRSACEILVRQVGQLTRLVDDLLDVQRIRTGHVELREELLDAGQLVKNVASAVRATFDASHQQLNVSIPAQPLHVLGDRARLTQVFSNLLYNANRYTPDGGRVSVDVAQEQTEIVVRIRDTGIGIPPDELEHIFELFAQANHLHDGAREGLGIGLALARRLVEMQGGRIEVRSEGEGRGSEFTVRLPVTHASTPEREGPDAIAATKVSRRVLIADDNKDAAVSLSVLLESIGHETRVVHDGTAALQAAEEMRPEVAILDIGMPGLSGYEVARRIADQPWAGKTLLVALTGWGQEADRRRAKDAGFHHYFVKPVEPDTLFELLSHRLAEVPE